MRAVVVGGGILGLAAARTLLERDPGAEVVVLEKERELATHQTGHNSGVVHAGLYYKPGSLKARLCVRGVELLKAYCHANRLVYDECGKVVVATDAGELGRLDALHEQARRNGVPGVRILNAADLREVEPHVRGIAALHSPHTAIVNYTSIAESFAADIVAMGGTVRRGTPVRAVHPSPTAPRVTLADGTIIETDRVLVCAGLQADRLAREAGEPRDPEIVPFRGEYWQLRDERRSLVRGLIYPVPDPTLPFLGVHLTKKTDGAVWIGPNAVLALAREGYRRRDFRAADARAVLASRGLRRLARRHWRTGATEMGRSASKHLFVAAARRYVPELRSRDVIRAPAGVRAQALDADGSLVDDFRHSDRGNVVWVRNAPSPAATSSLAIAEELVARMQFCQRVEP